MPSGKLGSAALSADTNTLLYTVPVGKIATVNIRTANRAATVAKIRVAIGTGGSPASEDYIEYEQELPANGVIEDTGLVCSAGEKIWAYSNTANVSVRVHGFEETL